jgi:hypothetical protein
MPGRVCHQFYCLLSSGTALHLLRLHQCAWFRCALYHTDLRLSRIMPTCLRFQCHGESDPNGERFLWAHAQLPHQLDNAVDANEHSPAGGIPLGRRAEARGKADRSRSTRRSPRGARVAPRASRAAGRRRVTTAVTEISEKCGAEMEHTAIRLLDRREWFGIATDPATNVRSAAFRISRVDFTVRPVCQPESFKGDGANRSFTSTPSTLTASKRAPSGYVQPLGARK